MIATRRGHAKVPPEPIFVRVKNHMKNALAALCALALLAAAGCVQTPDVTTYVDPTTRQRTDLLSENELATPPNPREIIWLNASRIPISRKENRINLEVVYGARPEAGYLDILPGRTLTVIADGQELKFAGIGSSNNRRERDGLIFEHAMYEAKIEDLRAIANAQKVTVLVRGKDLVVERDFTEENTQRFKDFLFQIARPNNEFMQYR